MSAAALVIILAGNFDAAAHALKAYDLALKAGEAQLAAVLKDHAELFRAAMPLREDPTK